MDRFSRMSLRAEKAMRKSTLPHGKQTYIKDITMNCEFTPKICICDLTGYTKGTHTGKWISLEEHKTLECIKEEIQGMMTTHCFQEYCVVGFHQLPDLKSEHPDLSEVLELAKISREYDCETAQAYYDAFDTYSYDDFVDRFCGAYDSIEEYVYNLVENCFDLKEKMGDLYHYFNYEVYARDLELSGDIIAVSPSYSTTYIFNGL
jgi:antirestriction protein